MADKKLDTSIQKYLHELILSDIPKDEFKNKFMLRYGFKEEDIDISFSTSSKFSAYLKTNAKGFSECSQKNLGPI